MVAVVVVVVVLVLVRSFGGGASMTSLCGGSFGVGLQWFAQLLMKFHEILYSSRAFVGHVRFLPCHDVPGILWLELVHWF